VQLTSLFIADSLPSPPLPGGTGEGEGARTNSHAARAQTQSLSSSDKMCVGLATTYNVQTLLANFTVYTTRMFRVQFNSLFTVGEAVVINLGNGVRVYPVFQNVQLVVESRKTYFCHFDFFLTNEGGVGI